MPPVRLKRVPVFSKLVIGMNTLLMFMLGYCFFVNWATIPPVILAFFLVFVSASANFIDLKDHEGDASGGIKTLPGLVGLSMAKKFIGAAFILTYLAAYVAFNLAGCFWLCVAAGVLQFVLINRRDYNERPVFVAHLLSLLFILCYTALASGKG